MKEKNKEKEGRMETEQRKVKKHARKSTWLIWLCWLVYMCSYLGKVNYSANITQIETFFKVTHAQAGTVSTFFFFAYGAGQIFNGVFCKKYNVKYVVFGGLLVSGACNLGVAFLRDFAPIKYLWLVNGAALSVLWPSLIRLLSEKLKREDMIRASVIMGTTVAIGTLVIYGLSALFVALNVFKFAFYTAAILVPAIALVWLFAFGKLTSRTESEEDDSLDLDATPAKIGAQSKQKTSKKALTTIVIFCFFAVATNLVAEGINTWLPSILKETYHLSDSLSILLTLLMPLVAVFGNFFANMLYQKLRDFVLLCGVLFLGAGVLLGGIIGIIGAGFVVFTLILFAFVRMLAGSSNSTITSIFPLQMKGKINSGLIAGVLNGCCYVGSTISSYGLGSVADSFGWLAVFYLLLGVCGAVVLVAFVYVLINKFLRGKKE